MKVFITGASSGLGAALARHYASQHVRHAGQGERPQIVLGLAGRDPVRLSALAASLAPATTATFAFDITRRPAIEDAAKSFADRFGAPDLVIANAGISAGTLGAEAADLDTLDEILRVNVTGLAATLQAFIPIMRDRGGVLAGIASVAGVRGVPGSGAYCASKSAAITWLEALRVELRGTPLRVVTVCPGYIDTPMTRHNGFRMPFLLDADEAARRVARAVDSGRAYCVVPWQMALIARVMRILPPWLFDRAFARAPRKPRGISGQ